MGICSLEKCTTIKPETLHKGEILNFIQIWSSLLVPVQDSGNTCRHFDECSLPFVIWLILCVLINGLLLQTNSASTKIATRVLPTRWTPHLPNLPATKHSLSTAHEIAPYRCTASRNLPPYVTGHLKFHLSAPRVLTTFSLYSFSSCSFVKTLNLLFVIYF